MRSAEVRKEERRIGSKKQMRKRRKEQASALCPFEKGSEKMKREKKRRESSVFVSGV